MKILIVYFTYNARLKQELNFDAMIKSSQCLRNLTMSGKIQIIKTFATPKLTYRASVLIHDKQAIKNVNSVIYNFLWNGKPDKIKRLAIYFVS